ncbi:MAG: DUF1577 domain-containing protein [Spirochaetes bacterium]|nr:DUF1577 domain-containing protein [Spirochaetota bacterium]
MPLLAVKQRKERPFAPIEPISEAIELLKNEFGRRRIYVKNSFPRLEVQINEVLPDDTFMIITDPEFQPPSNTLIVYGLLDKYIEFDLLIQEIKGPGYFHCQCVGARKALTGRRDVRFKMAPEDVVATNFKFSKYTLELTGLTVPTGIKVILDQFHTTHTHLGDIVKVDVFPHGDPLLDVVKKTGNSVFVEDMANIESYRAQIPDMVDLVEFYGDEIKEQIKRNVERGYKSMIICPIIYLDESEKSIPFAYIQVISLKEKLGIDKLLELKDHAFKLVDRIRDANTVLLPVHQQILDLSRGGAKLKITDDNLKKSLVKARGFIFDIVFKLQAPITIYGEIKFTSTDKDGNMYVGVDFAGNSSRKNEMKRYLDMIRPMEVEYKRKLMKEMKHKSQ